MPDASPAPVRVIEHVWITMRDGCTLAAGIWLPADAENRPVPAILEYIPYRRRDFKSVRDAEIHGFFAQHGYAGVRVDLRGSGDSGGILYDEYLAQELEDGLEVIQWIAAQPWCNGTVGLFGLSWGGFNALQLAALGPPEVGAIITVCSSDDRYGDDVHYMGGCLLTDNLSWASVMLSYNASPPDPAIVGAHWRDLWLERLRHSGLWIRNWLRHQRRDAFWKHASVCEDFSAIRCPVFAVSGWADGYCNTVFRLMENLDVPRKGLVGGWGHKYPHMGGPAPAIDFLGECVRWWDRWLKERENGVDREPIIRTWMQDSVSPIADERPGRWVAEAQWPSDNVVITPFVLARGRLLATETPASDDTIEVTSPLSVGLFAGKWCSYQESTDLPTDQRLEDGGSAVFDSEPLATGLEILGAPVVHLDLAVDRPQAMVAVRLSDIGPSGSVTLVTYGLLNLSHRESHETPTPCEPGTRYHVTVRLNHVAQRFPAGNRLRIAISSSYWPLAWPAPQPARLTLFAADCRLELPVRTPRDGDRALEPFGPPRTAPGPSRSIVRPSKREWTVQFNLATNEARLTIIDNDVVLHLDAVDLQIQSDVTETYTYRNDDYTTLRGEVAATRSFQRGDWRVQVKTHTLLTSTPTDFRIRATVDAYENETRVFAQSWDEEVPRDLM